MKQIVTHAASVHGNHRGDPRGGDRGRSSDQGVVISYAGEAPVDTLNEDGGRSPYLLTILTLASHTTDRNRPPRDHPNSQPA